MEKLQNYSKYYFLENYLFGEVGVNFIGKKSLTPFDLFAIAIWKANRNKGRIKKGIQDHKASVREISEILASVDSKNEESKRNALKQLTTKDIPGIKIPVASAFLSVLFPNDFTIVDGRIIDACKDYKIPCEPDPRRNVDSYFKYLNYCKNNFKSLGFKSLRDFDQALWGYSFCKELKEYVRGLE